MLNKDALADPKQKWTHLLPSTYPQSVGSPFVGQEPQLGILLSLSPARVDALMGLRYVPGAIRMHLP